MAEYKEHAEAKVGVQTGFKVVYGEATYKRFEEDAIFFRRRAAEDEIDDRDKKRYARIVILLMVLYLESLSNLLFKELVTKHLDEGNKVDKRKDFPELIRRLREAFRVLLGKTVVNKNLEEIDKFDKRTDLPKPIRRFRAVHKVCLGKELALNTDGIQDILSTIRNKIFVHPAGRAQSQTGTGEDGWSPVDKNIAYKKFKHFPLHYSHFTLDQTDELLKEVKDFSTGFLKMLSGKVSEKQLSEWWPGELVKWSERVIDEHSYHSD